MRLGKVRVHVFALLFGSLCTVASAQVPARPFRLGLLVLNTMPVEQPVIALLAARGFAEGKNLVIERRRAEGHPERLPAMAADLVREKVDVLVAFTDAPAFAARNATRDIPIVVWGAHDAVGTGLVASLARPGGNVTGVESLAPVLEAKRVQFLRELRPALNRLAVLHNPADQGSAVHLRVARTAADPLGINVLPIAVATREDVEPAMTEMNRQRPDAMLVFTDPMTNFAFDRAAEVARARRLPTACEFREFVHRGCLFSYGGTLAEFNDRAASLIVQILQGARPSDLPIQQVTRVELVLNRGIARQIGVTFSETMLLRADAVIE